MERKKLAPARSEPVRQQMQGFFLGLSIYECIDRRPPFRLPKSPTDFEISPASVPKIGQIPEIRSNRVRTGFRQNPPTWPVLMCVKKLTHLDPTIRETYS